MRNRQEVQVIIYWAIYIWIIPLETDAAYTHQPVKNKNQQVLKRFKAPNSKNDYKCHQ